MSCKGRPHPIMKVTYKPVNGEASIKQEHHALVFGLSRILEAVFPSLIDDPQASRIGDSLSMSLIHCAE